MVSVATGTTVPGRPTKAREFHGDVRTLLRAEDCKNRWLAIDSELTCRHWLRTEFFSESGSAPPPIDQNIGNALWAGLA